MTRTLPRLLLVPVALVALLLTSIGAASAGDPPVAHSVVVTAADAETATALVADRGGDVERELPLIGGVAATMTSDAAAQLANLPDVTVAPDAEVTFASTDLDAPPAGDLQLQALNPPDDWSSTTGTGVGVALIDTGVADVAGLEGRVFRGPDYSDEDDGIDRYGHGTFMAGLIAANGSETPTGEPVYGVAPGADIISVKVAGADGSTSLSTLIEAIGWVVVNQDEHDIRVLNLSVAVSLPMAPQADPLSAAVQAAWASGVTVVAAAGNEGTDRVTSPGRDPWIISVGSSDPQGTPALDDDTLAEWSSRGRVTRHHRPDVLAPGVSTISLRVPDSHIDTSFPDGRVGDDHFRGSGTSMSAALVSGVVAALAEERPFATPDDFKGALVRSGYPIEGSRAPAVDLVAADAIDPTDWRQDHQTSTRGPDGRPMRTMPWNQRTSPAPSETWARAWWADDDWARAWWAEMEWARAWWARAWWADEEWARAWWADEEWARAWWADEEWARAWWADEGWARAWWADEEWARAWWADTNWVQNEHTWVSTGWTAASWDGSTAP